MSKRKTGKVPRAQTVPENDSYNAPASLVQKEWGKVAKICPFDASAFLGLLDNNASDEIADDEEDNIKIQVRKQTGISIISEVILSKKIKQKWSNLAHSLHPFWAFLMILAVPSNQFPMMRKTRPSKRSPAPKHHLQWTSKMLLRINLSSIMLTSTPIATFQPFVRRKRSTAACNLPVQLTAI
ncbi:unnamed protein product [Cylindrotheca closterium]|uniref:Uncharacterized protein n=1 Tax=Cylindrotheca closterium TaxID=2856 RepID=A0AAD2JHW2_9STRA|nr:unnamed protein product [Cylindrotheca closterium]